MDDAPKDNNDPIRLVGDETRAKPIPTEKTSSIEFNSDSLFETYHPRSVSSIISQQQAVIESEAAEAAGIILEGVEPPEFDFPTNNRTPNQSSEHTQLLGRTYGEIRVQRVTPVEQLFTPGAQFIYALLIISLLGGLIGLAATIESPALVLIAGISLPILLPICVWKWHRWLDSAPYYYRLLTSLGEDARNLLEHRLFSKRSN